MNRLVSPPTFIALAPMEGVVDHTMREMFSAIGGIDRCVTEFIRVSHQKLPNRTFKRYCPELEDNSHTSSGTPVYLQLLGDNPELMAHSAMTAVQLGAIGIDINFGCPAKTVNNSGGGAFLLQEPETLFNITRAIRAVVPQDIPVTAKMRLGYEDKALARENALALEHGGASEITIHARTKTEGYRPPAYWDEIGKITDIISIPIIANGEIWNIEDMQRCQNESKCSHIMLGRGLIACPDLALFAKGETEKVLHWGDISLLLIYFFNQLDTCCPPQYLNSIIKQWLAYLRIQYIEANVFFDHIKRLKAPEQLLNALHTEFKNQQKTKEITGKIGRLDLTDSLKLNQ